MEKTEEEEEDERGSKRGRKQKGNYLKMRGFVGGAVLCALC